MAKQEELIQTYIYRLDEGITSNHQRSSDRRLRIFISYSHADQEIVLKLYDQLESDGFQPWMDEHDLLPGQNWESEIRKAVQESQVFLACISQRSVNREGFVHAEIGVALKIAENQPEGSIFIIPVRLEDSIVPDRLKRWHWCNYFRSNGYQKLLRSLDQRAEQLGISVEPIDISKNPSALLFATTQLFLERVGFTIKQVDEFGFLCTSNLTLWQDVSPLYVRLIMERTLDMEEFQSLCQAAEVAFDDTIQGHTAAVVIDRPPNAADLHQIFALRAQQRLTIIPLSHSFMLQASLDHREQEELREHIDLYTGRSDLYDIRAAVTDVLSFFGRNSLLRSLEQHLTTGRSVIIFGVRKIGKSSLLGRLREECPWSIATVDIQGYYGSLEYVYDDILASWQTALKITFPTITLSTVEENKETSNGRTKGQAFRHTMMQWLDELAKLPNRPGLLLFIDEMDMLLEEDGYIELASILRSIAESPQYRGRFAVLMAGLDPSLNRSDRLYDKRNPFYAFFKEVPVGMLEPKDIETMIISIGGQMGINYEPDALARLVHVGGGHAFLTRQLCSHAVRNVERPATITLPQVEHALEDYLYMAKNYLAESLWGLESGGPPAAEADILKMLAKADQPLPNEAIIPNNQYSIAEKQARYQALQHLQELDLIRQDEQVWLMTIPLYQAWIRQNIIGTRVHLKSELTERHV